MFMLNVLGQRLSSGNNLPWGEFELVAERRGMFLRVYLDVKAFDEVGDPYHHLHELGLISRRLNGTFDVAVLSGRDRRFKKVDSVINFVFDWANLKVNYYRREHEKNLEYKREEMNNEKENV